jgi:hypothetical protein
MAKKWGLITSGAMFQSLACTLIFFEDPNAALFGRPGKDGAQDARSGDGTRVFQMKHHQNASAAAAIRDAKEEAATVAKYRTPGHARHGQWLDVKHWRLVTNAVFNTTDQERWDNEVVPLFKAQGFDEVDRWSQEYLDGLLAKHPEVHRAYFENETRAFLSVPEMRERVHAQELFLRRDDVGEIFGRTGEVDAARTFLGEANQFLVVHGAGGIGKTRLLLEIGETIASEGMWQVLWANIATMSATSTWFDGVVRERPTLLLVDEPDDEKLLKVLLEQFGPRVSKSKVAITVRSPKDPVLRFLDGARIKARVKKLAIAALADADAVAMCESLLATGKLGALPQERRTRAAQELSKRFARHPVWLTLAVQHLEERGDLTQVPASAQDLADEYLREIEMSQAEVAPEVVRELLRWVALVGKVNRDDGESIEQIGRESGVGSATKVLERLNSLVKRRVLVQRGKDDRLYELKPDVLRDHVLVRWLSIEVGGTPPVVASDEAKALLASIRDPIVQGTLDRIGRSKLIALARTEFLLGLGGFDVDILASLFDSIRAAVPSMSAGQRVALAEVLESIAVPQPRQVVLLIRALRSSRVEDERIEGVYGDRVVRHEDVILSLAWPLAHAAMGARDDETKEAVLRELCAVVGAELQLAPRLKYGLPNDGKRGASLVTRVLEGGPEYWGDFDAAGKKLSLEILDAIATRPPTSEQRALLKALVQTAMAVERRQQWSDDRAFHWRTYLIAPGHPAWTIRNDLLEKVKQILAEDGTPLESRLALWPVFVEAHRQLNFAHGHKEERKKGRYTAELVGDLEWTRTVLEQRKPPAEELSEARAVWDWHRRFEEDPVLKAASLELEEVYTSDAVAKEFEYLLSHDDWEQHVPRAKEKSEQLALCESADEIKAFIERGARFIGGDGKFSQLYTVAEGLGRQAEDHAPIREFVQCSLREAGATSRQLEFALVVARSWIFAMREGATPERCAPLVEDLLAGCVDDSVRVQLLMEIYGRVPRASGLKDFTREEHALFRRKGQLFAAQGRISQYITALAVTLKHDWPLARAMLEELVRKVSVAKRPEALHSLLRGVFWAVRGSEDKEFPERLGEWLLDQLVLLPDFDDIGGNDEWHLKETLKRIGRPTVRWLPPVLAKRRELETSRADDEFSRAISHHVRISRYVQRITAAEASKPEVTQAVEELLGFIDDSGTAGYYLPEVLNDVDPDGLLVPGLVVARVAKATEAEQVRRLARIGGKYVAGTRAWEDIAKAVLRFPLVQSEDDQRSIFSALGDRGVTSWSGIRGEVPPVFVAEVESTKSSLEAATDEGLRRYWAWRVRRAEADLREEEQRAKEERGE